jgi:isopenicillin-N N-acyltransferase like protein
MSKTKKKILVISAIAAAFIIGLLAYADSLLLEPPGCAEAEMPAPQYSYKTDSLAMYGPAWLRQQQGGLWELYVEGSPCSMGWQNGFLTKELNSKQEHAFFQFINSIVPGTWHLSFLKYFIAWFNKDLDNYIPLEHRQEIYALSRWAEPGFNFIAEPYQRMMNYHAAHDIGHAMQNMSLVKCTALGISRDSVLIAGRNFDFSAGDSFAEDKIIMFQKPGSGYAFASVTWAGMVGVVSGMNIQGLSITLNSAQSGIPASAKTPVSIIARDVLQYARTIAEAYEIISSRESFVAEMFMIASAEDNAVAVIEKSLDTTVLRYPDSKEICLLTNHYQSQELKSCPQNMQAIDQGISTARMERLNELAAAAPVTNAQQMADVLRDRKGAGGTDLGMGNEASINQLIAHHGVIFCLYSRTIWVSERPHQMGRFAAYELQRIFSSSFCIKTQQAQSPSKSIAPDPFLETQEWSNWLAYKEESAALISLERNKEHISPERIAAFAALNPKYYGAHLQAASSYRAIGMDAEAAASLQNALQCKGIGLADKKKIENMLTELQP